jgi:hypothetical protein
MKKYRLNEALVSYDNFLTKTNESEMTSSMSASASPASAATVSDVRVDAEYVSNLSAEIDTIINGLKDISIHLEPEVVEESENKLNEKLSDTFFDGDPLFPLLAGGLAGILGIFGLGIKAVKDSKRNKQLGASVESDFDKLKSFKITALRIEGAIDKLKEKQGNVKAESGEEAEDSYNSRRPTATSDESPVNAKAAVAKKKAKIVAQKIGAAIQTLQKKKDDATNSYDALKEQLDEKYSADNLSGFFSGKVRKLIAFKKNEIAMAAAEFRLKNLSDDPEERAKQEDIIKKVNADMQAGLASVKKEDEENENKVKANKEKIIAEFDKKIKELENLKKDKEGKAALVVYKEIIRFRINIAKLEEDAKKITSLKLTLKEVIDKIDKLDKNKNATVDEPAKEEPVKNSKEDKLSRVDDLLKKAEDAGDVEKIKNIKDLRDRLAAKESWQLEGTELSRLFEMEIKKLELSFMLNESMSVKDAFSRLI